jgi:hypothetical protein
MRVMEKKATFKAFYKGTYSPYITLHHPHNAAAASFPLLLVMFFLDSTHPGVRPKKTAYL